MGKGHRTWNGYCLVIEPIIKIAEKRKLNMSFNVTQTHIDRFSMWTLSKHESNATEQHSLLPNRERLLTVLCSTLFVAKQPWVLLNSNVPANMGNTDIISKCFIATVRFYYKNERNWGWVKHSFWCNTAPIAASYTFQQIVNATLNQFIMPITRKMNSLSKN